MLSRRVSRRSRRSSRGLPAGRPILAPPGGDGRDGPLAQACKGRSPSHRKRASSRPGKAQAARQNLYCVLPTKSCLLIQPTGPSTPACVVDAPGRGMRRYPTGRRRWHQVDHRKKNGRTQQPQRDLSQHFRPLHSHPHAQFLTLNSHEGLWGNTGPRVCRVPLGKPEPRS